jgi:hypothetical protein
VGIRQPTILEVLVNQRKCEIDTVDDTPLVTGDDYRDLGSGYG